jgi:hypothetical protein
VASRVARNDCCAIVVSHKFGVTGNVAIFSSVDVDSMFLLKLIYTYESARRQKTIKHHHHHFYHRETITFFVCVDQKNISQMKIITWNQFHATDFLYVWPT